MQKHLHLWTLMVLMGTMAIYARAAEKCQIPEEAPKKISQVIAVCEDEIKVQIIAEALLALDNGVNGVGKRSKRAASQFTEDDRRIAGCLLQCVYRKLDAVNENGLPTVEGLVNLYTGGSRDRAYVLATFKAVNTCLYRIQSKFLRLPLALQGESQVCERAYEIFECVSDQIGEYCGETP